MPKNEEAPVLTAIEEAEALLTSRDSTVTAKEAIRLLQRVVEEAKRHEARAVKFHRRMIEIEAELAESGDA